MCASPGRTPALSWAFFAQGHSVCAVVRQERAQGLPGPGPTNRFRHRSLRRQGGSLTKGNTFIDVWLTPAIHALARRVRGHIAQWFCTDCAEALIAVEFPYMVTDMEVRVVLLMDTPLFKLAPPFPNSRKTYNSVEAFVKELSNIRPATTGGMRPRYRTGQHMLCLHCHY